jgi:DNA repair photolyase
MVQVFLEKRTPLSITTKSHHIQDDLGLLAEFAQSLPLTIFMTITSTDEALTRQLEPTTCTVKKRLETIRKLANTGITVGVLMAPVFPGMTDNEKMMESVAKAVSEAGAIYWYADLLNLREQARDYFMPYKATYAYSYPPKAQRQRIRQLQVEIAARYGLNTVERSQIVPPSQEPLATQLQFDFGA